MLVHWGVYGLGMMLGVVAFAVSSSVSVIGICITGDVKYGLCMGVGIS